MSTPKQIVTYLLVAFSTAWALWITLGIALQGVANDQIKAVVMTVVNVIAMWTPALGVLVVWLINKRQRVLHTDWTLHFKTSWKIYLCAWLLPTVFSVGGGALFLLFFPNQIDLSSPVLREQLAQLPGGIDESAIPIIISTQILSAISIGPFINIAFALGEEIGWRGFLYPSIRSRFSPWIAHLIMGFIWGIWHTPINMLGHNYGNAYPGYPVLGIVAMCIFCLGAGMFLSWATERSGSIWPAALGHASINAIGGIAMFASAMVPQTRIYGPAISGIIPGLLICVITGALIKFSSSNTPTNHEVEYG